VLARGQQEQLKLKEVSTMPIFSHREGRTFCVHRGVYFYVFNFKILGLNPGKKLLYNT
jgi:hypothetical protein